MRCLVTRISAWWGLGRKGLAEGLKRARQVAARQLPGHHHFMEACCFELGTDEWTDSVVALTHVLACVCGGSEGVNLVNLLSTPGLTRGVRRSGTQET
jgi:hypothetical protein